MTPRLDAELVRRGLARSRGEAVRAVLDGRVRIDGTVATRPAQKADAAVELEIVDPEPWVARSAHKLVAALDAFGVDPSGRLCLDIGASTGGFTQVLLDRGARAVVALDVGHGQLVDELRRDPRVRTLEGVNARELTAASLAELSGLDEAPSLVVVDVSFIPLRLVLPAVVDVLAGSGQAIALVKPQFEVGRSGVRRGIVGDRDRRLDAVRGVMRSATDSGLDTAGVIASPLPGASGNREYLCAFRPGAPRDPVTWESRLSDLP